ncbi:amidase [SAR202 cluster bacterium AD-804-J14_MRT_500m]|nr:amidase [SAR202 cluster bacterium AD-804-J14_MRT_500m]
MDKLELCYATIEQLAKLISSKQVSPTEVTQAHLDRIAAIDGHLNSFITVLADQAIEQSKAAEREIQSGHYRGPFHGTSLALKDLYYSKGTRTTSGAKVYNEFIPDYDSDVGSRFNQAGAILLGKLNLFPIAMGGSGVNPDYGDAHNPWDLSLETGGSSSGSGAAVAAGLCSIATGSDTGGSIRIPASFCGLVGFKPTYGLVSRHGVSPLSWSMDHCGPMTRSVIDCAMAMNVLTGHDQSYIRSSNRPAIDYVDTIKNGIRGLRIGVPKEFFEVPLSNDVSANVLKALDLLGELGAEVREVSWPDFHSAVTAGSIISLVEGAAIHADTVDTRGQEFTSNVRPRVEAGKLVSAADYIKAQQFRRLYVEKSFQLMENLDLLVGPTTPVPAFKLGAEDIPLEGTTGYLWTSLPTFTRPFNFNGFPAISVVCGFSGEGLPIGMQISGRPFEDATVLRAAYSYEHSTDWSTRRPPI